MRQQFFKLYLIITVSLIALVLAFGQLYNEFFSEQKPSIQISIEQLVKLVENKHHTITSLDAYELILPDTLATKLSQDGVISVIESNQQYFYLKGDESKIHRIGPIETLSKSKTDWLAFFAFYLLLAAMILVFIRPVFRDLSLLQRAAYRFSKKPQRITLKINNNSSIAPLAQTFTQMSERIDQFIQLHSDLSRIISHEIRTPLSRMRFALSIADLDTEESLQIERDIEEIEQRLQQYLSFARLEHQYSVFKQQEIDMKMLIKTELNKFNLYKELNFSFSIEHQHAHCEPSFMAIAVQNLLINATTYARKNILVSFKEINNVYVLSVTDDGTGLPVNADALIEPFQQGEGDKLTSGYGLGLYIVYRIASWHGGKITLFNSAETGGASIAIHWPKNDM